MTTVLSLLAEYLVCSFHGALPGADLMVTLVCVRALKCQMLGGTGQKRQ